MAIERALALWRGDAPGELRYEEFAQAEVNRLDELRLVAVEERLDAELALGRHNALVAQLESLISKHPLRERAAELQLVVTNGGNDKDYDHAVDVSLDPRLRAEIAAFDPRVRPARSRARASSPWPPAEVTRAKTGAVGASARAQSRSHYGTRVICRPPKEGYPQDVRPEPRVKEIRVLVRFADSTEVGFLSTLPRRGQRLQSPTGDVSFVTEIVQIGVRTYTVVCGGPAEFLDGLRGPTAREDLASSLLSLVRNPLRLQMEDAHATPTQGRSVVASDDWIEKYFFQGAQYGRAKSLTRARKPSEPGDWLETYLERGGRAKQQERGMRSALLRSLRNVLASRS